MSDLLSGSRLWVCAGLRKALVAVAVVSLCCLSLSAQLNTGRISGAVADQTGGVIAGASVSVVDVARGETRPLTTDAAGLYAAPNLVPGTYTLHVTAQGFQTVDRQNVVVTAGSDIRVDVTLLPGAQTQTVTVTEALPIINTTNAQTGGTLDQTQLANLPINGRNYRWQSNFVPGVVVGVGEGSSNQSVNGTPLANGMWNFIFDGLYSETFFTLEPGAGGTGEGGDATLMPLDAIQEVQVVLNPKAEFGWAPGVTENMALKSGTNNMHGSAYAYGRDTSLDAKNPITGTRPEVAFEQFGATLGGPIKKDKLFYFVGYEGERVSLQASFLANGPTLADLGSDTKNSIPDAIADINQQAALGQTGAQLNPLSLSLAGCDPSKITAGMTTGAQVLAACNKNQFGATGLFNNTSNSQNQPLNLPNFGGSNNGLAKLDYHLSEHHSLNGSIYIGRYSEYLLPRNTQLLQQYWEELLGTESDMGRLVEIWSPNANWLNEARVGVDHGSRPVVRAECAANGDFSNPTGVFPTAAAAVAAEGGSVGGAKGPNYLSAYGVNSGALGCGIPTITINGFSSTLGFGNNREDWENPIQGADSVSYTRGTHQFKFGVDVRSEHVTGAKVLDSQSGTVTFGSANFAAFNCNATANLPSCPAASSATALEDFLAGAVSSETIRANSPVRNITSNKIGVFVQDDWRVKPKLTLNLGFRWEAETPERDANGQIGTFIPGTPTGMVQNNTLFKFQSDYEPRFGFAYDLTGKGRTVVRGGFGVMYMIPQLQTFVAGGTGQDYGGEPTGATLIDAAGNCVQGSAATFEGNPLACGASPKPTVGNITSVLVAPQSATTNGLVNSPAAGGLAWNVDPTVLFSPVAVCGNGLVPTGAPAGTPKNPPTCTGVGGDPNLKLFPYYFWNLGVQHAFTNNLSLDVSYVGSHTSDIYETFNINSPSPGDSGGSNEQGRRAFNTAANNSYGVAYPWFATINYSGNFGSANYAGLQTNLTLRNVHGVTVSANYTLSHALAQDTITDVRNPLQDYGNLAFDARDHFTLTASYAIPAIKAPAQLLQGWAINGSANIMSPLPLDVVDGTGSRGTQDVAGTGGLARWSLYGPATPFNDILGGAGTVQCYALSTGKFGGVGSPCITVASAGSFPAACIAGASLEPNSPSATKNITGLAQLSAIGCYAAGGSAIVPPAQGTYGNMTPNELRGKAFHLVNFSVTKEWKIKESLTTQFRWEIFNLLNQTQYGTIGVNLGQPGTFGLSQSTPDIEHGSPIVGSGGPREMQLALRFVF